MHGEAAARYEASEWFGLTEPHLAVLHCGGQNRIAFPVVPPETIGGVAVTAMLLAAAPGNRLSTSETLASASAQMQSTSHGLIATGRSGHANHL